ncbi:hypothetical protein KI387_018919, partial [Taxus chinensis]
TSPVKEKEREESPVLESPVRKKQKVTDEADSEETEDLDAYIGDRDDDEDEPGGEDHPIYEIHDSEEEGDEEYNEGDEEKEDEEEAETQGKG